MTDSTLTLEELRWLRRLVWRQPDGFLYLPHQKILRKLDEQIRQQGEGTSDVVGEP